MRQRVLITAGAKGIGLAISEAFLAAGARVHAFDRNREAVDAVVRRQREDFTVTRGDVSSADTIADLIAEVRDTMGGLDVLVSNAGAAGPTAPVEEYDPAAWHEVIATNLTGSFNLVRAAVPLLKETGSGTVLIMSSLAGRFGYPNRIAYSTTKWGLVGFTKTLSLELGPHRITVNAIHPGAVQGARLDAVFQGRAEVSGRTPEEEREAALANQAVKSFVDPADIGQLAVFLAGPHARTISGQQFNIDGDSKAAQ